LGLLWSGDSLAQAGEALRQLEMEDLIWRAKEAARAGRTAFDNEAMDETTRQFYEAMDREHADRYEAGGQGISRFFDRAFEPGTRILDVGGGTGRDLATLLDRGWDARGVEPVPRMRTLAEEYHPELAGRIAAGELPTTLPSRHELGGAFHGVVCSAVLQHLHRTELAIAVTTIRAVLRPLGRVLVSVPDLRSPDGGGDRDDGGRLYSGVTAEELDQVFDAEGFARAGAWTTDDSLGRADRQWVTRLYELR